MTRRTMKSTILKRTILPGVLICLGGFALGHTLFLKPDPYFVEPGRVISLRLLNGTFNRSENTITRDRMTDFSVVLPGGERDHPEPSSWRDEGPETVLDFKPREPGTYLVGVSTSASLIDLGAGEFNEYLEHDGVLDVLEERRERVELGKDVTERYSKHVKALFQAGEDRLGSFETELGYPVEIVPLQNPFSLDNGDLFRARILRSGEPLADQLVYVGNSDSRHVSGIVEPHHESVVSGGEPGYLQQESMIRSDSEGIIEFKLDQGGIWYVRFIHMVETDEPGVDYESNWATLTFAVGDPRP